MTCQRGPESRHDRSDPQPTGADFSAGGGDGWIGTVRLGRERACDPRPGAARAFRRPVDGLQFDQSAARPAGSMAARKLIVFKHDRALGSAPSHELFDRVKVQRATDESIPARAFSDYNVTIDRNNMPQGVTLEEKI